MPILIPVWLLGAILIGFFGRHRRFGFWGYFFASILLSPIWSDRRFLYQWE
jgi:hypothetical protein